MPEKQQPSWSSAPIKASSASQTSSERRRGYVTTLLTVLLTAAIIAAGFVTPNIFYSITDSERGAITVLADTDSEDVHVFDEYVSLYPWNLYKAENTIPLSYADRGFLYEHNVPNFLITTMSVYGMDIEQLQPGLEQSASEYAAELLVNAFNFLRTDDESSQGCYIIYTLDVNGDGTADLQCAVDQGGVIISQIFLSDPWIVAVDETGQIDEAVEDEAPPANAGGADGALPDATTPEDAVSPPADESEDTEETSYALVLDGLERMPVGEELAMWSFVHLISLSAAENGQHQLAEAASILDDGFTQRYANPEDTAKTQPSDGTEAVVEGGAAVEDEVASEGEAEVYSPTYTIFTTEEHRLYIYDLPNGMRFILYYDVEASRCVGFNLQL